MEEKNLLASVELKIDNLDARNMRQLNQLYAEIKTLQGTTGQSHPCCHYYIILQKCLNLDEQNQSRIILFQNL